MNSIKDYSLESDALQMEKVRIIKGYLNALEGSGVADWYIAVVQQQGYNAVLDLSEYESGSHHNYVKTINNAYKEYNTRYDKLLSLVEGDKVHVYRALQLSQQGIQSILESPVTPPLGIYWTYDRKSAKVWGDPPEGEERGILARLEGYVKETSVNWGTSLYYNMNPEFAGEREIRIPSGTPVEIVNVWVDRPLEGFDAAMSSEEIKKYLREIYSTWVSDASFYQWVLGRFQSSTGADPVYNNVKNFYINYFIDHFDTKNLVVLDVWNFINYFSLFELFGLEKDDIYLDYVVKKKDRGDQLAKENRDKIQAILKRSPQQVWRYLNSLTNVNKRNALQGSFNELIKQPWVTEIPLDKNFGFNFEVNEQSRKELQKKTFKT